MYLFHPKRDKWYILNLDNRRLGRLKVVYFYRSYFILIIYFSGNWSNCPDRLPRVESAIEKKDWPMKNKDRPLKNNIQSLQNNRHKILIIYSGWDLKVSHFIFFQQNFFYSFEFFYYCPCQFLHFYIFTFRHLIFLHS